MKSFLPVLLFIILFWSCKQEKSAPSSEKQSTENSITIADTEISDDLDGTVFKTSTGKSIELITDQKSSSLNDLKIIPLDFSNTKDTLKIEDCDPLQNSWIQDLDQNGFDELYLITASAGSGSYAKIYGYASNQDLSMTPIHVPEISDKDLLADGDYYGYMGHDSIYIANNKIYRKYPVYKEGDPNCCPSGGDKTLSYTLQQGEASWILKIEN
ncbi:MAG: hypothetical protein GY908_09420 [Flavobacteriales bacterium]|nr:hypothetical protein [Flavobacteriales bacterium]